MALYFFDMRVGAELLADKDGLELPNRIRPVKAALPSEACC
jgi:hypothetical protein